MNSQCCHHVNTNAINVCFIQDLIEHSNQQYLTYLNDLHLCQDVAVPGAETHVNSLESQATMKGYAVIGDR